MRSARPFTGSRIVWTSTSFAPQLLHVELGLGLKLEKASFLNSSATSRCSALRTTVVAGGRAYIILSATDDRGCLVSGKPESLGVGFFAPPWRATALRS